MKRLLALLKKLGLKPEDITEAETIIAEVEEEHETAKETEVAGLKAKNKELLKKLKEQDGDAAAKVPELEEQIEKLTEANKKLSKDLDATAKAKAQTEKELGEKYSAEQKANHQLLVDNGLTEGLAKLGIKKEHLPAVKALLQQRVAVEAEGDIRKAVVAYKAKDGKDSKLNLSEYLEKEWSGSDEGKSFIPVNNSGSGSQSNPGGGGQGAPKTAGEALANAWGVKQ